jgi:hypothetical protein
VPIGRTRSTSDAGLALATDVPLPPATGCVRRLPQLLGVYRPSLPALAREPDEAAAALRDVLAHDSQNPYYLWVAYGRQ